MKKLFIGLFTLCLMLFGANFASAACSCDKTCNCQCEKTCDCDCCKNGNCNCPADCSCHKTCNCCPACNCGCKSQTKLSKKHLKMIKKHGEATTCTCGCNKSQPKEVVKSQPEPTPCEVK